MASSREKRKRFFKWTVYSVCLLLFYCLEMAPGFFRGNAGPNLMLPFVFFLSMYEGDKPAIFFSIAAGFLKDCHGKTVFGFHSIIYLVFCVAGALLVMYLVRSTFLNGIMMNSLALFFSAMLSFFFRRVIFEKEGALQVFSMSLIPSLLFSILFSVPIYFIVKKIHKKYYIR